MQISDKKLFFTYNFANIEQNIDKVDENEIKGYTNILLFQEYDGKYELLSIYNISDSNPFGGSYSFYIHSDKKDTFFLTYLDKWNKNSNISAFYPHPSVLKEFIIKENI